MNLPPEGLSRGYVDQVHANAFRDLEGDVCDLDRMGEISNNLIMNCSASEDGLHDLELAAFAVFQLAKMLKEFRASYYKRWGGAVMKRRRRSMRKRNRQRLADHARGLRR